MKYFEIQSDNSVRAQIIKEVEADTDVSKIVISDRKGELVSKDLENKKIVYIDFNTKQISSSDGKDESLFDDNIKKAVEAKIKEKFQKSAGLEAYINMALYTDALLALSDAGFVITNENREEKYIEIIETGEEKYIELLEVYIEAKDDVDALKWHKRELHRKLELLQSLEVDTPEFKKFVDTI